MTFSIIVVCLNAGEQLRETVTAQYRGKHPQTDGKGL